MVVVDGALKENVWRWDIHFEREVSEQYSFVGITFGIR